MGAHRDDADLRMGPAQLGRQANALVGHRRWHPDVDQDDVGVAGVDRRRQLLAVRAHGDELDLVGVAEQARERLPDEEAVVGHTDAHRHGPSVTRPAGVAARRHACGKAGCRHSVGGQPVCLGQEEQRRLDALADVLAVGEAELEEDRVDVLLDRPLGQDQRVGDRRVALALGDLGEDLALASGERGQGRALESAAWRRRAARRSSSPAPTRRPRPPRSPPPAGRDRGRAPSADRRGPRTRTPAAPARRRARRSCSGRPPRSPGGVSRNSPATRMPSSVLVGGIRMSVTTTSGRSVSTAASSEGRSPHEATTRIVGLGRRGSARRPRGRSGCHRPRRWRRAYTSDYPASAATDASDGWSTGARHPSRAADGSFGVRLRRRSPAHITPPLGGRP